MSRVGKSPVAVPQGVDVQIKEDQISVKGAGGTLSLAQNALVKVTSEGGKLSFTPVDESREANAMSGTMRCPNRTRTSWTTRPMVRRTCSRWLPRTCVPASISRRSVWQKEKLNSGGRAGPVREQPLSGAPSAPSR